MILKNKSLFNLILLTIGVTSLYAQNISSSLTHHFSPSIIRRVYLEVASKVPLSEASQLWLATAYAKQDSMISTLIVKGTVSNEAIKQYTDSTGWVIEKEFKKVMTAEERKAFEKNIAALRTYPPPIFKDHIEPQAEMNSLFGTALKIADQLVLSDLQGDSLLSAAVTLKEKIAISKTYPENGYFDQTAFESEWMSKILTDQQYNLLLATKNKLLCETYAKYDWHELETLGLTNKYNHDSTVKKLTVYYLLKTHITQRFAHEKEKSALLLAGLKVPPPLQALRDARLGNKAKLEKYAW